MSGITSTNPNQQIVINDQTFKLPQKQVPEKKTYSLEKQIPKPGPYTQNDIEKTKSLIGRRVHQGFTPVQKRKALSIVLFVLAVLATIAFIGGTAGSGILPLVIIGAILGIGLGIPVIGSSAVNMAVTLKQVNPDSAKLRKQALEKVQKQPLDALKSYTMDEIIQKDLFAPHLKGADKETKAIFYVNLKRIHEAARSIKSITDANLNVISQSFNEFNAQVEKWESDCHGQLALGIHLRKQQAEEKKWSCDIKNTDEIKKEFNIQALKTGALASWKLWQVEERLAITKAYSSAMEELQESFLSIFPKLTADL